MKALKIFFLLLLFVGCGSDDFTNVRAFVEGNVSSATVALDEVDLHLESQNKVIAQTKLTSGGHFVLSGPLFSEGFQLVSNKKIKSFTSSKPGCTISPDFFSINIPAGVTYVEFPNIELQ